MIREDLLAALAWQVELGADDAITEEAQDRFAESAPDGPGKALTPQPARKTRSPAEAARPVDPRSDRDQIGPARLASVAGSLEALHATIAAWDGSELKKGAQNCVFSDGRPGAHLMIIGEAPGADEDRQGKPFVGRAGQLLDRMLAAIALDRTAENPAEAAYISNILPWRPPGNRTPSEAEIAAFLPFMLRHIELARPQFLLTVGNTPTKALLGTTTGIKRMRGTWRRHSASGLPLLPSFHPAYLLRQPAEKRLAWHDLKALRRALDGAVPEVEDLP
ncbi:MAG: uracil-DNA glycosylase [Pseudomonadota bacterium]